MRGRQAGRKVKRCRRCRGRRVFTHDTRTDGWVVALPDKGVGADHKVVDWPYCRQCRILADESRAGRDPDVVLRRLEAEEEAAEKA